jgi:hypothetical protein
MEPTKNDIQIPTGDNDGINSGLSIEVVPPDDLPSRPVMTTEGKRKRVGFTSDTTPPSPDIDTVEQRHFGDVVQTPEERSVQPSSAQVSCDFHLTPRRKKKRL